jgi:hypothetical protein
LSRRWTGGRNNLAFAFGGLDLRDDRGDLLRVVRRPGKLCEQPSPVRKRAIEVARLECCRRRECQRLPVARVDRQRALCERSRLAGELASLRHCQHVGVIREQHGVVRDQRVGMRIRVGCVREATQRLV